MLEFYLKEKPAVFNNENHLKYYTKYLFSQSSNHQINERTADNLIYTEGRTIENVADYKKELYNTLKYVSSINYKKAYMKLIYIGYFFWIDDEIITNIYVNGKLKMDAISYSIIVNDYYDGVERALHNDIEIIKSQGLPIIHIDDTDQFIKSYINNKLLNKLKEDNDVVCALHADQDSLLHFHTISKK